MKALLTMTLALGFMITITSELIATTSQSPLSSYQQVRMTSPGWGYWGWGRPPGYSGHNCAVTEDYDQPVVACP